MSGPRSRLNCMLDIRRSSWSTPWTMRFSTETMDLIPTYKDLLRLTTQLQLLTAEQARKLARTVGRKDAQRVLASTVELREALAAVLYGRIDGGKPPAATGGNTGTALPCRGPASPAAGGRVALVLELVWRGAERGDSAVDAGPGSIGFAGLERRGTGKGLRRPNLPLALPRSEQEPYPAMVRHEDLRQPDEGAKTPGALPGKSRACKLRF